MRSQRGFTLIELLVVFAIAGLLIAVVPMAYDKLRESTQYRQVLRDMLTGLREARQQASNTGRIVRFQVDLAAQQFRVEGRAAESIEAPLRVRVTVADVEMRADQVAQFAFLPDGGGTGGSIELVRPSGAGTRLRVDWLTGHVTHEALLR